MYAGGQQEMFILAYQPSSPDIGGGVGTGALAGTGKC